MREGPGTKQDGNQLLVFERHAKAPSTKLDLVTRELLVHNRGQQAAMALLLQRLLLALQQSTKCERCRRALDENSVLR